MYLVDTSVWIDYFREIDNSVVNQFADLLYQRIPFGITGVIYQEILQGAVSQSDFDSLVEYLSSQRFFHVKDEVVSYQEAAKLYFQCRRKGITIRSTIDCLIAQVALEHGLILLHKDEDFYRLAEVIPKLQLCPVQSKSYEYKIHEF